MHSRNFNISSEIQPRLLPRQSSPVTSAAIPAVPEVSQIFDSVQVNYMPLKSSPISSSYSQWKQQVPQKMIANSDIGIRNSPKPAKNPSPVDSPSKISHRSFLPSNQPLPSNFNARKPENLSPNSYARDSRLKFYQKVSFPADSGVFSPKNPQEKTISSSESHRGTTLRPLHHRSQSPTQKMRTKAISVPDMQKTAIPGSEFQKTTVPTSEYHKLITIPASDGYRVANPSSHHQAMTIATSEGCKSGRSSLENYRPPIPPSESYRTGNPSSQFHKQSTSATNLPNSIPPHYHQPQRSQSLDLSHYATLTSDSKSDLIPKDHRQEPSTAIEQMKTTCDCHSQKTNNDEIITQLLCLIQGQHSQIQMLQGQVETLLSLRHERIPIISQEFQSNFSDSPRLEYTKSSLKSAELDERHREEKLQQLIKEKKVSIGVMTSFELTVQDSVVYNAENAEKTPDSQEKSSLRTNTAGRSPNKVMKGLEQIVEASESHLSSTLQASNNCHTCLAARRSLQRNLIANSSVPGQSTQSRQENRRISKELQKPGIENDCRNTSPHCNQLPQRLNSEKIDMHSKKLTPTPEKQCTVPEKQITIPENQTAIADNRPAVSISPGDVPENPKKTPKLGWTLYDNVMCQVNEILHNSNDGDTPEAQPGNSNQQQHTSQFQQIENQPKLLLNEVQQSTMEQLKVFGFTFADTTGISETRPQLDVRGPIDGSYYPRLDYQANIVQSSSSVSDTSMHMKALAMKYLGTNQLPNVSTHKRGMELLTSMMISNMQNNMSVTSINDVPKIDAHHQKSPKIVVDYQRENYIIPGKQNPQNILDISSLKRQPKLL